MSRGHAGWCGNILLEKAEIVVNPPNYYAVNSTRDGAGLHFAADIASLISSQ